MPQVVAARLGRCILELGGNNGMIVTPSANLDLALRAIVFSAAGAHVMPCQAFLRRFDAAIWAPLLWPAQTTPRKLVSPSARSLTL